MRPDARTSTLSLLDLSFEDLTILCWRILLLVNFVADYHVGPRLERRLTRQVVVEGQPKRRWQFSFRRTTCSDRQGSGRSRANRWRFPRRRCTVSQSSSNARTHACSSHCVWTVSALRLKQQKLALIVTQLSRSLITMREDIMNYCVSHESIITRRFF